VTFEAVKPDPCKDYMCQPTIKTFLDETALDPLVSDKRKRVGYRGSSTRTLEVILAKKWFGCRTMHSSDPSQVESIFRSENVALRQVATLSLAEVITFACTGVCSLQAQNPHHGPHHWQQLLYSYVTRWHILGIQDYPATAATLPTTALHTIHIPPYMLPTRPFPNISGSPQAETSTSDHLEGSRTRRRHWRHHDGAVAHLAPLPAAAPHCWDLAG
jgi:hypothetical protein